MSKKKRGNELFPVFFKLDNLKILLVGGGAVATEKTHFLLKSSPNAQIKIISLDFSTELLETIKPFKQVKLTQKGYELNDLQGIDLVIAATNDRKVNQSIWKDAKQKQLIINVADTPELCDFYMGSIVTRGDLKIAISTNGKSPTFAKRFRQLMEEMLPEESSELVNNLRLIRDSLTGSFTTKVKTLNEITSVLVTDFKK